MTITHIITVKTDLSWKVIVHGNPIDTSSGVAKGFYSYIIDKSTKFL